jgi:HNH homing endonuclease
MNYELLYNKFCDYCKNVNVIERIKRRNPLDERLIEHSIYQEEHHIVPRHSGGSDAEDNFVKMLPEEHYLAHYIRFRAFGDRKDFLSVRFIFNGLPRYLKDDAYLSINKKVSKWKNHIYFFRKNNSWHTIDGINKISNARKNKVVVIDKITREMIGSVDKNHPNVLSGRWVNHTYGTIYVWNKKDKRANRILKDEFDSSIHEPYIFKRDKENNFNYKHIDENKILDAILKHVDSNLMIQSKLVLEELKISEMWVKRHYGSFSNLIILINNKFGLNIKYGKYQRTDAQKLKISQTLREKIND